MVALRGVGCGDLCSETGKSREMPWQGGLLYMAGVAGYWMIYIAVSLLALGLQCFPLLFPSSLNSEKHDRKGSSGPSKP